MQYHRLFAGPDGESRWETVPVALRERAFAPPAERIFLSDAEPAVALVFLSLPAGWNEPTHPSPKRQTLVCTKGRVRVTASDGDAREIGPGDIWRMEDTAGTGHHTAVIGEADFEAVVVQFD